MRIMAHRELDAPREFAWSAIDDASYDGAPDSHCPIGRGRTEAEAIADLQAQLDERTPEVPRA